MVVHSVYKAPTERFVLPALGHRILPHIVIGDYNSHSTTCGYTTTYNNGEAKSDNITLIQNYRNLSTANDEKVDTIPTSSLRRVFPIPHSQHRRICVSANPVVLAQPTVSEYAATPEYGELEEICGRSGRLY